MEESENLLVVILDINAKQWSQRVEEFKKVVDSVMVFCNSYLMMNHSNRLAFYTCNHSNATILYPAELDENESRILDGKFELFVELNTILSRKIKALVNEIDGKIGDQPTTSLLSGAFSQALCYIHKKKNEDPSGQRLSSRILVIKASPDVSSQYMPVMNCIFASQKHNIAVDSCSLFHRSGFLQQAADITGGTYNFVDNVSGFLELLIWIYLPEKGVREKFELPSNVEIDYRAACFCHNTLIEMGFVCSVCLSIYCKFMPKCLTCQTRFRLPQLPPMKGKKKKKVA